MERQAHTHTHTHTHTEMSAVKFSKRNTYVDERHSSHIVLCDMYESQNEEQLYLIQY
jgi:hypothetical protein